MMTITPLPIAGAAVVSSSPHEDARGVFARLYCVNELAELMPGKSIVQANTSRTIEVGAVRGMHYQRAPSLEAKLIRCLRGRVFDVLVDLRQGSSTFLHWVGRELSPEHWNMMVVPEGCAHGFQVLEPDSEMLYLHTAAYAPGHEAGVRFDDPAIGIDWPLAVTQLSDQDQGHALISDAFEGVAV